MRWTSICSTDHLEVPFEGSSCVYRNGEYQSKPRKTRGIRPRTQVRTRCRHHTYNIYISVC